MQIIFFVNAFQKRRKVEAPRFYNDQVNRTSEVENKVQMIDLVAVRSLEDNAFLLINSDNC